MDIADASPRSADTDRPTVTIDIYSDVVCPWCYIGKRRFEKGMAAALADGDLGVDFEIEFKPFQLDPTAAPGAAGPVVDAYAKKFGGLEKAEQIIGHVTRTASEDGLQFRMDQALRANTLLAHRLIWWAAQPNSPVSQDSMKERLLQAYFMDGKHVGDPAVLADVAAEIGADRDEVIAFLESTDGTAEVAHELEHAADNGITAVPTYVFNDQWAVPGAQDAATFEKVLRKMADRALASAGGSDTP